MPSVARLFFGRWPVPVELAGAELRLYGPDGQMQLSGWVPVALAAEVPAAPDRCLVRAEVPGHPPLAVAQVDVDVTNHGEAHSFVSILWEAGEELPPAAEGDTGDATVRRLRRETVDRRPAEVLAQRLAHWAAALARGQYVAAEVVAEVGGGLTRRHGDALARHPAVPEDVPGAELLRAVLAADGVLATTAGETRRVLADPSGSGGVMAALGVLGLATLPRTLPDRDAADVVVYASAGPLGALFRAAAALADHRPGAGDRLQDLADALPARLDRRGC
ncbi:hypothetical protein GCM10010357_70950 [Streptomyces luteireticuli]|uniref:DUF2877 domain-containing protein n=2 Tax=Streptomyces luteireticuli TaxID=173858 RepID=A0ABN0Z9H4_9ACTN